MKKLIAVITILVLSCSFSVAQSYRFVEDASQQNSSDGFFSSNYQEYREENLEWGKMPMLPGQHGYGFDYSAVPVGSGLLLLGAFGLGYAIRKRSSKED